MHDIKAIRDNPAGFDAALARRGLAPMADKLIELDEARRANITALQEAQSRRNAASKEIGKAKAAKDEAKAAELMAEVASLKQLLEHGADKEREDEAALQAALEVIPNLPREDVPDGKDEHDNVEVRKVGTPPKFSFKPKQHFELGEALGLMDFESAGKVSGARFVFLKGALARMERALAAFMLDQHTAEANGQLGGYTEVNPPLLVNDHTMFGTAQLPKFESDQFFSTSAAILDEYRHVLEEDYELNASFQTEQDFIDRLSKFEATLRRLGWSESTVSHAVKRALARWNIQEARWLAARRRIDEEKLKRLWLIPTAEVSLTNLVREAILDEETLPLRYTAATPCFRSEAGSAGRDTRGMIRQHQFTKVELVSITTPEASLAEHERMTRSAETILERLGLPFRTVLLCTGDMGFASQKTYDIEVWLPGQDAYREISSCSVCGDFQARRMNARYRPVLAEPGQPKRAAKETRFVHTLNGSGLAVGRTLVAILENYQQADGSIVIPEALRPYMRGMEKIG